MINVEYIIARKDILKNYGSGIFGTQVHAATAPITNQLKEDPEKKVTDCLDKSTRDWVTRTFTKKLLEVPNVEKLWMLMDRLDSDGIKYSPIRESGLNNEFNFYMSYG